MFDAPSSFAKFPGLSQMSFAPNVPNITTGNPIIDQIVSMLLMGSNVAPRPHAGQSVMESYLQRQRSMQYLQTMRHSFGNQLMFSKLGGLNTNGMMGNMAAMFLGNPDGPMNHPLIRAFNGGNPVQAQMSLMARGTGMTAMAMTGQIGENANVNFHSSRKMMEGINSALFHQRTVGNDEVREAMKRTQRDTTAFINADPERKARWREYMVKDPATGEEKFDHGMLEKARKSAKKNFEKLPEIYAEEFTKMVELTDPARSMAARRGEKTNIKLNAQATRGFEIQDLTKSMMMGVDLGLVDYNRHFNAAERRGSANAHRVAAFEGMKNQGRVLRAVSDLTGDTTAESAMGSLNAILGNSKLDMTSDTDAKYAEDLLRRVKGMARTAGVSIDVLMGINNQVKALASQHPGMQFMGGTGAMETSLRSLSTVQAIAGTMGNSYIRSRGGMNQFLQEQAAQEVDNMTQPVAQHLYAARAYIHSTGDLTDEQKTRALQLIQNRAGDAMGDFSAPGQGNFDFKMAQALGISIQRYQRIKLDNNMAQRGMQLEAEAEKDGKGLGIHNTAKAAYAGQFQQIMGAMLSDRRASGKFAKSLDENGNEVVFDSLDKITSYMQQGLTRGRDMQDLLNETGMVGGMASRFMDRSTPGGQARFDAVQFGLIKGTKQYRDKKTAIEQSTRKFAEEDADLSARLAHLNQPFGQMLAQELISGNLSKGYSALQSVINTPEGKTFADSIAQSVSKMSQERTGASIDEAWFTIMGGKEGTPEDQVFSNLKQAGITKDMARYNQVHNRRVAKKFNEEQQAAFRDLGSKGLTINQIMRFSRDFDAFEAAGLDDISHTQINEAAAYASRLGLDSGLARQKYGNQSASMQMEVARLQEMGQERIQDIAKRDAFKQSDELFSKKLSTTLNDLSGKDVAESLRVEQLLSPFKKDGGWDSAGLAGIAQDLVSSDLEDQLKEHKLIGADGSLNVAGLAKAAGSDKNRKLQDALVSGGFAKRDLAGNVEGIDSNKLIKGLMSEGIAKQLKDSPIFEVLEKYSTERGVIESKFEGQKDPNTELKEQIAGSSASLTDELRKITSALTQLINAQN